MVIETVWPNTYLSGQVDGIGVQTVSQVRVQLEGWCDLHNLSEKGIDIRRSVEMNLISEIILISTALGIRWGPGSVT